MPRSVARRQRDSRRIAGSEQSFLLVEFPNEDLVEAKVDVQHEAAGWICRDHMSVCPIMSADGELPRGAFVALVGPILPDGFLMSVARRPIVHRIQ